MVIDRAALNALTTQWQIDRAALDEEENKSRINYNNVLSKLRDSRQQGFGQLAVGAADRGLTHSGINAKSNIDLGAAYTQKGAEANTDITQMLSSIARRRLEADAAFNAQRGLL